MSTVESSPYNYCDVLSVDPLRDVKTGVARVGITVSDGDETLSVCCSVDDAEMLIRQLREALETLAEAEEAGHG